MSDPIERQAAIETVRKAKSKGEAHRMLIQMPTAQPWWIPFLAAYLVMSLMISAISGNLRAWKGEQDG